MPKAGIAQTSNSMFVAKRCNVCLLKENLRNLPSFQQSIDHGSYSIEWHAWRSAVMPTFTTFVYERSSEPLLRHFAGSDENEVIWQALTWCERNS